MLPEQYLVSWGNVMVWSCTYICPDNFKLLQIVTPLHWIVTFNVYLGYCCWWWESTGGSCCWRQANRLRCPTHNREGFVTPISCQANQERAQQKNLQVHEYSNRKGLSLFINHYSITACCMVTYKAWIVWLYLLSLEEKGQTALGPALLLSILLAGQVPGSKVCREYIVSMQTIYITRNFWLKTGHYQHWWTG